jgi:hypothetical protein
MKKIILRFFYLFLRIKNKLLKLKTTIILYFLSQRKKTIKAATNSKIRSSKKTIPFGHTHKNLVLSIQHGGLGDHLFYSHIPRIAKETKKYDRVYVSQNSNFRNSDTKKLIWNIHPYIDGFCNEMGFIPQFTNIPKSINLLDKIMIEFGLDDGKRFHEPEMYLKPEIIPFLKNKTVFDPNYISLVGKLNSKSIQNYLDKEKILIDYQMSPRNNTIPIFNFKSFLKTESLVDFCSVIVSCKKLICMTTGTATLAAALGKPANVLYGTGVNTMFHHSKLHTYMHIK